VSAEDLMALLVYISSHIVYFLSYHYCNRTIHGIPPYTHNLLILPLPLPLSSRVGKICCHIDARVAYAVLLVFGSTYYDESSDSSVLERMVLKIDKDGVRTR
jgi:hypothetical protein